MIGAELSTLTSAILDSTKDADTPNTLVLSTDEWLRGVSYLRVPRPPRAKRRRSRQCRGKRARNYVRAVTRDTAGSHASSCLQIIVADASATGALASLRRLQERAQ